MEGQHRKKKIDLMALSLIEVGFSSLINLNFGELVLTLFLQIGWFPFSLDGLVCIVA